MRWRGAISAGAVATTVAVHGLCPFLPAALVFVLASCVLVVDDVRERRLPALWLAGSSAAVLVSVAVAAYAIGEPERLAQSLLGSAVAAALVAVAAVIAPHGLNGGDVAYAGLIGATLGWYGVGRVGLGLALGFLAGAVLAGPMVAYTRRQAVAGWRQGRGWQHGSIPFGPPLAAGAWLALCFGDVIQRAMA